MSQNRTHRIGQAQKTSQLLGAVANDGLFFFDRS